MKTSTKGTLIASAAAALFLASAALAQDSGTASGSAPQAAQAQAPSVKCVGANACKGNGSCKSAQNDCKGKNACKGQSFVMTSSSDECTGKGGKPAS
jgi:hypothetical protein